MAVERLHAHAVVEDDAVAVDAERRRVSTLPRVRRHDRRVDDAREIEAEMDLPVDLLALVDVGALVRERRLDRGVGERMEDGAAPAGSRATICCA